MTVSPTLTAPASGCSSPTMVLNSVVLPTPFGPMMPTMPLRGSENDRLSMSTRSSKPLTRSLASITVLPRRGPGGIWISSKSSLRVFSASAAISSYRSSRALDLVWRALALERTHSSSSARRFCILASLRPSTARRCGLLLQVGGVVALVRVGAAAVELEDPLGHVVQEVPVVGDRDDRAGVLRQVLLQPQHALGVEVVGGLVEQQQVGLLQQQLAQRDPAALTTGELGDVGVRRRAAQRVHRLLELGVDVPRVGVVELLLELAHLVHQLVGVVGRHQLGDLVEPGQLGLGLGDRLLDVAEDGLASR